MEPDSYIDPHLTQADLLVLRQLLSDVENPQINLNNKIASHASDSGYNSLESANNSSSESESTSPVRLRNKNENSANPPTDTETIDNLHGATNPKDVRFEPTVFLTYDLATISLPFWIDNYLLQPYIKWARKIARVETDVVMVTHLILYFTTSVPSAIFLFYHFSYLHAILHCVMQAWYTGSYTLMRHQHIHMKGVLAHRYAWIDGLFPYITDPLTGHTWNSYYYHHVKHHHVEGNGPDDLSSTIRYQRDDIWHFAHYVGRFLLFTCLELPLYFLTKGRLSYAARIFISEFGTYTMFYLMARYVNTRATTFVFLVPFTLLRLALMVGNWGQHAFVDEVEPDSDYRSSITLIDVPVSLFSFLTTFRKLIRPV